MILQVGGSISFSPKTAEAKAKWLSYDTCSRNSTPNLEGKIVTCRGYGWKYDVTTSNTLHSLGFGVNAYPVNVIDGTIWAVVKVKRATRMKELLTRLWEDLVGRIDGPLAFRLILQPIAVAYLAIRAGVKDARSGHPAYGWAVVTDPARRRDLLQEGSKEIAKVFVVAVIIDLVYEIIVFRAIYLGQSLIVAVAVALVPYLLIRGPINRIVRHWHRGHTTGALKDLKGRTHS